MNKTNRTTMIAYSRSGHGAFGFRTFPKKDGRTDSPPQAGHGTRREATTAAQAARLSQAFGDGWSFNLRPSYIRSKVAA